MSTRTVIGHRLHAYTMLCCNYATLKRMRLADGRNGRPLQTSSRHSMSRGGHISIAAGYRSSTSVSRLQYRLRIQHNAGDAAYVLFSHWNLFWVIIISISHLRQRFGRNFYICYSARLNSLLVWICFSYVKIQANPFTHLINVHLHRDRTKGLIELLYVIKIKLWSRSTCLLPII